MVNVKGRSYPLPIATRLLWKNHNSLLGWNSPVVKRRLSNALFRARGMTRGSGCTMKAKTYYFILHQSYTKWYALAKL